MASTHLAFDLGAGSGRAVAERTLASTSQSWMCGAAPGRWTSSSGSIRRLGRGRGETVRLILQHENENNLARSMSNRIDMTRPGVPSKYAAPIKSSGS